MNKRLSKKLDQAIHDASVTGTGYVAIETDDSVEDDELNDFMFQLPEGIGVDFGLFDDTSPVTKSGCHHVWKDYYGLTDAFEFCELCDEKRELKNG